MQMKTHSLSLLLVCSLGLVATSAMAQAAPTAPTTTTSVEASSNGTKLTTAKAQMSYASGVMAVRNFTKNDVAFDIELVIQGMRDTLAGKELAMNEKEIRTSMNAMQVNLRRSMALNLAELSANNRKRGLDFLAAYKQKPGVQVLGNGVAFRVLKAGTGAKPAETESVVTIYRGANIDNVEFDATLAGKTSTLRMNQAILGLREALKQMPVGSKWEIAVPSQLAYGERGVGEMIGPNEVLFFEVELLDIKK
jgi:FKBP-type peptidyl-prolyl cis-trans isomerase FklB